MIGCRLGCALVSLYYHAATWVEMPNRSGMIYKNVALRLKIKCGWMRDHPTYCIPAVVHAENVTIAFPHISWDKNHNHLSRYAEKRKKRKIEDSSDVDSQKLLRSL
jgi:hypothetical protein